ncbi:glutathione S-transferase family protein [Shimia abyssi]|uniref:Glutathione S-transferase n=1 Tax=Shimia abyssi TaxID=1662395 RepID=A0A2P8F4A6_9RHOB|nr:glutathione S-transferase family protein [Shimia abyssi]PSL16560.1 glutathione S-transferase [Shimia abyssi]
MLTLLTFPGDATSPTHSPFCLKAMCLLEMAGQDWQPELVQDLAILPLGRAPVLRAGDRLIPDSHHIQGYLEALGADFYPGVSDQDRAIAHALIRMTEENLRTGLVYSRWLDPQIWPIMREAFFADVPAPARADVANGVQEHVRAGLMAHGIAQFDPADRLHRLVKDVDAIELTLGRGPFLFGDLPTAADAAIAPVLDMLMTLPVETDIKRAVASRHTLTAYVSRVRAAIYPSMQKFSTATNAVAETLSA